MSVPFFSRSTQALYSVHSVPPSEISMSLDAIDLPESSFAAVAARALITAASQEFGAEGKSLRPGVTASSFCLNAGSSFGGLGKVALTPLRVPFGNVPL